MTLRRAGLAAILLSSAWACEGQQQTFGVGGDVPGTVSSATSTSGSFPEVPGVAVERELVVLDDSVVRGPLSDNSIAGAPWSFRTQMENIAGDPQRAQAITRTLLRSFDQTTYARRTVASPPEEALAIPGRGGLGSDTLFCSWYQARAANECNEDCSSCKESVLDLAAAPFRLIGVVNRLDLHDDPCAETVGQGRLVYGVVDASGTFLAMTLSFEFALPNKDGAGARGWAERWHALGKIPIGPTYTQELAKVTAGFLERPKDGSPWLAEVRTNDSIFGTTWELRSFAWSPSNGGELVPFVLADTPGELWNGSEQLTAMIANHESDVLKGHNDVPSELMTGYAPLDPAFSWQVNGVQPATRDAFAKTTCNGCHTSETGTLFAHLIQIPAPYYGGGVPGTTTQVSGFLEDDVMRRGEALLGALQTSCSAKHAHKKPGTRLPYPASANGPCR